MTCAHAGASRAQPRASTCEDCSMDHQLRVCNACGHVGCADSHEGHATAHATSADHPILRELTPQDDGWTWCNACGDYVG